MPSIIKNVDVIPTAPLEITYQSAAGALIGNPLNPPVTLVPKNVFINGFPVVGVGDVYLPHTDLRTHETPTVLTSLINVYANGVEVAIMGSPLLDTEGCAITLIPVVPSNVYARGPNIT